MNAPGDPTFEYLRTEHPRWRWRTNGDYSWRYDGDIPNVQHDWVTVQDGLISIPHDYHWNGANVAIDTKTILRGSCLHDALYQTIRSGAASKAAMKEPADKVLYRICREDGMWAFRAWYVYRAVRIFGASSLD